MVTRIINGRLVMPDGIQTGLSLYMQDGVITHVTADDLPYDRQIDAAGHFVAPGFIDTHVHGGGGCDFMDGSVEAIVTAANYHLRHGTTSIMPTALASSRETLCRFLDHLRTVMEKRLTASNVLGAHIEGPYFSLAQAGAQNPLYIRDPDPTEYIPMLEAYGDLICRWSFAPERQGAEAFCRTLLSYGVAPSIAHSDAVYEEVCRVYEAGCRTVTHLYSGMSTITRDHGYRRLGVVESAYLLEDMAVEVIADGKHLPAELLRLILKGKSREWVCLVTDAMRAAGTDVQESLLGPLHEAVPCIVEDEVAKLPDRQSFAGSVATADRLVRTMVQEAGVPLEDAVYMITAVPARLYGLTAKGKLCVGCDADVVIFDEDIRMQRIFIGGEENGDQNM